jgi:hypothetical protein
MKCPYQPIDCRYVDTSTNTMEKSCKECECSDTSGARYSPGCMGIILILLSLFLVGCKPVFVITFKDIVGIIVICIFIILYLLVQIDKFKRRRR